LGKTSIAKPSREKLAAGRLAFLSVLAAFLLLFGSAAAIAQEIVTLSTRPGVTQSFFIANLGENPQAIAILFPGSGGLIRLRQEKDQSNSVRITFWLKAVAILLSAGWSPPS